MDKETGAQKKREFAVEILSNDLFLIAEIWMSVNFAKAQANL